MPSAATRLSEVLGPPSPVRNSITLRHLIGSHGAENRLPVTTGLYVGFALARTLAAMHQKGEVHGGLSPERVLLGIDGSVAVLPAGGKVSGPYVAPELRGGEAPDALGDIYATGAILFEVLTGMTFVQALVRSPMRQLHLVPTPSSLNPGVDPSVDEIVVEALAKDPGERPHTMHVFLRGIAKCFEELDLTPAPTELARLVVELMPDDPPAPKPSITRQQFPRLSAVPPRAPTPAPALAPKAVIATRAAAPVIVRRPVVSSMAETIQEDASVENSMEYPQPRSMMLDKKWLAIAAASFVFLVGVIGLVTSSSKPKSQVLADEPTVAAAPAKQVIKSATAAVPQAYEVKKTDDVKLKAKKTSRRAH